MSSPLEANTPITVIEEYTTTLKINGTIPFSIFIDVHPWLITFYVPVFLLSITANTLVIIVVFKYHYMRNVTNVFLVNLSVADLMVTLLCMPVQVVKAITLVWYFGSPICKIVGYMQGVAVAASVFTITAMAVGRFLAITRPISTPSQPKWKWALLVLLLLWIIAFSIFSPLLWVMIVQSEPIDYTFDGHNTSYVIVEFCIEHWGNSPVEKKLFGSMNFILVYAIPGFIVVVAYSLMGKKLCSMQPPFDREEGSASTQQGARLFRERKRVAWILLLLAVLFAICWLPYNTVQLLLDFKYLNEKSVGTFQSYSLLLGHMNSAINPIVYCFMTRNFRSSVKKLVCRNHEDLSNRQHQRCRIRWPARAATSSSGYDSYHSPHRKCYLQMHSLKRNTGTQLTSSGARVSRRLQYVGAISANRRQQLVTCSPNGIVCPLHHCHHECDRDHSPRYSDPEYI
ncbi:neuropeptide FF receptor 1-like [Arctopsyche grandis]|uniref:neuropeptide FF receptor 1-like n=1 Tax=Arctopsyche grandis TaxID=121162 RepID=UPI00406DA3B3